MVGQLSEKELFSVLKALYRALQKSVHPDLARGRPRRGDAERAVELNLAFEALNLDKNPVAFRRHRKSFVARRPRQVYQKSLELEKQLALERLRRELLSEACLQRLLSDYQWPEDRGPEPEGCILLPLKNVRLGLLDVAINQNLKLASWTLGSNYKEFKFDAKGRLSVRPVGSRRFGRADYIRLLGTVDLEPAQLLPFLERPPARFFKAPALTASGLGCSGLSVLNRISYENFRDRLLPHLKAQVRERGYLFSLNRPQWLENRCLTLEGQIVKVERMELERANESAKGEA